MFSEVAYNFIFSAVFSLDFIIKHSYLYKKLKKNDTNVDMHKGPFKYYVIKKVGGWGWPNTYVCLQGGWVGVAKCLRNYKKFLKKTKLTSKKSCMGLQFLSLR